MFCLPKPSRFNLPLREPIKQKMLAEAEAEAGELSNLLESDLIRINLRPKESEKPTKQYLR